MKQDKLQEEIKRINQRLEYLEQRDIIREQQYQAQIKQNLELLRKIQLN